MTNRRAIRAAIAVVAGGLLASSAMAYIDYVPLMATGAWQANSSNYLKTWRKYVNAPKAIAAASPSTMPGVQPGAAASTVIAPTSQTSRIPAELAADYPAAQRAEIENAFRELLSGYRKIEQQFGIPRDDMAGAVAALIAGSWMAYRNSDFPDANFKPLVVQMRQILASNEAFRHAGAAEKRESFERMAILGTFMATVQMAQKQKPDARAAQNAREAARGYLEQFLQTDADRIELTPQGLRIR